MPLRLKAIAFKATRNLFLAALLMGSVVPSWGREQKTLGRSATDAQLRAADTFLDQQNPTSVNGGSATLAVRSQGGARNQRSLVLFDLSAVPNVGIKTATLTLRVGAAPSATRTYNAHRLTSFFTEAAGSWNNRVSAVPWGTAGGDFNPAATASTTVTPASTTAAWDVTADVRRWYNSTNPTYGTLIKDRTENAGGAGVVTVFSSKEDLVPANRPQLTLTFVQNVANLAATPGNGSITLSWSYPAAIGTVLEANTGVLILRRSGVPVDKGSVPADGTNPALCSTVGSGTVVFTNSTNATTFIDNAANPCGGPTNGTMWYYKVFIRDTANNYTSNVSADGSVSTAEISAMPNPTPSTTQRSLWMVGTYSTNLAAPGLTPGSVVMVGAGTNLLFGVNPNTGARLYPAVATGGPINGRPPVIEAALSSLARSVTYIANQDNFVYAIDTGTGQIVWLVNPTGLGTNSFQGNASVQLKALSGASYTRATDLVILGTSNTGTTTGNRIAGIDGNTGATVWQLIGNSGGNPAMDVVVSSALVDYVNGAIWVTTNANGGTGQPSLWKLNPNTGARILTANLNDISSSPTITPFGDVLFVGNDNGVLYAINPVTGATLNSFDGGDAVITGYPDVLSFASPYTIIISGATSVQAISYNKTTNTFTRLWTTPISTPSAPLSFSGLGKVYVGSDDGMIHELDLATGSDSKQRVANLSNGGSGTPAIVGDPSLDVTLMRVYVSATDQRMYAFAIPF